MINPSFKQVQIYLQCLLISLLYCTNQCLSVFFLFFFIFAARDTCGVLQNFTVDSGHTSIIAIFSGY